MLKKLTLSLALVCLVLGASLPAHADDAALGAFKQFLKCVATKNDAGAWHLLNGASQKWVVSEVYGRAHEQNPSITEEQVAAMFDKEEPKVLAGFFDGFRQKLDFGHMLSNGEFMCKELDGSMVALVKDGDTKWASVMVQDGDAWKLDLDATMKLAK